MNKTVSLLPILALGASASVAEPVTAPAPLEAKVDLSQTAAPVSPHEFGMFIEHIGSLIYRSLWTEMLDDRKFFSPIAAKNGETSGEPESPFRPKLHLWTPLGAEGTVTMDKCAPFVGEQSPCIALDPKEVRGIAQKGLKVLAGKGYTGRVYLRADPGTKVTATLAWGPGEKDRQSVTIEPVSEYVKYPLAFTAGADSSDASLTIAATGTGSLHIGAVSLMPEDNVAGFRPDAVKLLRDLHSGLWRLPGGNVISAWSWYDSVGDPDRRPSYFDPVWNAVQSNDVGLDEFMTLCRLLEVDPYVSVNAGFGDAHSAAEEVEYLNGATGTRMGALRAANGHPEPYAVKYWNIGNEPYGNWQFGRTNLKYYTYKHIDFARAMRKVDPSITLLASGSMPDRIWADPNAVVPYDATKESIGDEWDWTGGLFAHCMDYFDGMTEHWYAPAGMRYDPTHAPKGVDQMFAGYVKEDYSLLEWVRYPADRVEIKAEQWAQYEKMFPEMAAKKKFLAIDEYAFMAWGGGLKAALAQGLVFNEMLRHTGVLTMSAHTMGTSAIDLSTDAACYNSTGLVFFLYRDLAGCRPVTLSGNSAQPKPKYPPSGDIPRTTSGSPTYPLDMTALLTPDGKTLLLFVVNATESAQSFDLSGVKAAGPATMVELTGSALDAENHAGKPAKVTISAPKAVANPAHPTVAPYSISLLRIPVEGK
jgi:alpha-N-arabinofuranosidase